MAARLYLSAPDESELVYRCPPDTRDSMRKYLPLPLRTFFFNASILCARGHSQSYFRARDGQQEAVNKSRAMVPKSMRFCAWGKTPDVFSHRRNYLETNVAQISGASSHTEYIFRSDNRGPHCKIAGTECLSWSSPSAATFYPNGNAERKGSFIFHSFSHLNAIVCQRRVTGESSRRKENITLESFNADSQCGQGHNTALRRADVSAVYVENRKTEEPSRP